MIPILKERLFVSLAENAKKLSHKKHFHSVKLDVSLKNARRVRKFRQQKVEREQAKHLQDALSHESVKHHTTKKNSSRQIELLKAHLSIYKDSFETFTKEHHEYTKVKKKSDQLAILEAIRKELIGTSRQITNLAKHKEIKVKEKDELQGIVKSLKELVSQKSAAIDSK